MRTGCGEVLLKNAHLCNFFLVLQYISEVRRIWAIALSRLHESQTHQSGFWFLTMFWFPFQLFSQLNVWLYHWSQELHWSLAEVLAVSRGVGAEMWPWENLQTTGIELCIKYTCSSLWLCTGSQGPMSCSWAPLRESLQKLLWSFPQWHL